MSCPLTPSEEIKALVGKGFHAKRSHRTDYGVKDPTAKCPRKPKDEICLMEFKHMSDVTNRYVVRAKCVTQEQYEFFRSTLSKTMQHPGWIVEQISSSGSTVAK